MIQLILWLNPYRKEITVKGQKYKLSEVWIKKTCLLNNIRILLTIGALLLAYVTGICEKEAGLVIWGIVLGVQVIFLGVFYLFIPNDIEKLY